MKKIWIYVLFLYVFVSFGNILKGQSHFELNSRLDQNSMLNLVGLNFDDTNFDSINGDIGKLNLKEHKFYIYLPYSLDKYLNQSEVEAAISSISDDNFIAAIIYRNEFSANDIKFVIKSSLVSESEKELTEQQLELISSQHSVFNGQSLIDVLEDAIESFLFLTQYEDRIVSATSNNRVLANPFYSNFHSIIDLNYLSISGIPFYLPEETYVQFAPGNVYPHKYPELIHNCNGMVLGFSFENYVYQAVADSTGQYFKGYRNKNGHFYSPTQEIYPNKKYLVGDTSEIAIGYEIANNNNCDKVRIQEYKYFNRWQAEFVSRMGGPFRTYEDYYQNLGKQKVINVEFNSNSDIANPLIIEKWVLNPISNHELNLECDPVLERQEVNNLLADGATIVTSYKHENGATSTILDSKQGRFQYYLHEGKEVFRIYQPNRKQWAEVDFFEEAEFIRNLHGGITKLYSFSKTIILIYVGAATGTIQGVYLQAIADIGVGTLDGFIEYTFSENPSKDVLIVNILESSATTLVGLGAYKTVEKIYSALAASKNSVKASSQLQNIVVHDAKAIDDISDVIVYSIDNGVSTKKSLSELINNAKNIIPENKLGIFVEDLGKFGKDRIKFFEDQNFIKAWEKISAGGISDFITNPGYMKTLEKVAKYQDEAAAGSTGTVKYYRVQTEHPDSKILKVETNGNLTFNKPDVNLNLSTTTREHADYYAAQKIAQGNTVEIIEFEVPKAFDIQMKQTAVPQYKASQNLLNPTGTAPKIVDPLQPGDPFELPGFWNQQVQTNYIPGSAKIVN